MVTYGSLFFFIHMTPMYHSILVSQFYVNQTNQCNDAETKNWSKRFKSLGTKLDSVWIQCFSSVSLNSWLAGELGGWRKLKIEIVMPSNLPGFCVGHLSKCLITVVSLLCLMSKWCEIDVTWILSICMASHVCNGFLFWTKQLLILNIAAPTAQSPFTVMNYICCLK